ncbi:MAG: FAD:protein FMN transferase [Candidatus Omnitrophota bacterium]
MGIFLTASGNDSAERSCILLFAKALAKASAMGGLMVVLGCQAQPQVFRDTRVLMGTYVEVVSDNRDAARIVFDEIKRVEGLLSKYDPQSEVSQFNEFGRLSAGPDLYHLLTKAKEYWFATDGAFDITVGPAMDLWGFTTKDFRRPSDAEIADVLKLIGTNKIIFHPSNNVVEFNVPGMEIDLGSIGKGYAVDCAVKALRRAGISNCLINAGGQVYGLGTKAGKPWRVAIKDPRGGEVKNSFDISDQSAATSGDYEQYFVEGDKRFSHIIDPRTGSPADSGVISATVIAADGLTADFLATSLVVLGKRKGMELLKRFPDSRAQFIEQ